MAPLSFGFCLVGWILQWEVAVCEGPILGLVWMMRLLRWVGAVELVDLVVEFTSLLLLFCGRSAVLEDC